MGLGWTLFFSLTKSAPVLSTGRIRALGANSFPRPVLEKSPDLCNAQFIQRRRERLKWFNLSSLCNDPIKGTKTIVGPAFFPLIMKTWTHAYLLAFPENLFIKPKPYAFLSLMSFAFHKLIEVWQLNYAMLFLSIQSALLIFPQYVTYILSYVSHI